MAARFGGAVRISLTDHRTFLARLRSPIDLAEPGIASAGVNRTVTGEVATYATTCISETDGSVMLATTTTQVSLTEDCIPDSDGSVLLLVALETHGPRPPSMDVLTAAGLPAGVAVDLVTGMPARTREPANFPNLPWQFKPGMETWLSHRAPSMVVLVSTTTGPNGKIVKAAEKAIPLAMRSAVTLLGISPRIDDACDEFLVDHDIEPLRPETVCVLRQTPNGIVEHYRSPVPVSGPEAKRTGMRLTAHVEEGLRRVALDLAAYLTDATLAGLGVDPRAEVVAVSAELGTVRANLTRTQASLARAEDALVDAQRRQREAEHALSLALAATESQAEPEAEAEPPLRTMPTAPEYVPEPEQSFASFPELLAAAREELDMVVLGDVDASASALDVQAKASVWRARTWSTLVMLQRFAEDRSAGSSTGFRAWLDDHPGPLITPDSVVPGETTFTASTPGLRAARLFAVPQEVDPDGVAYFGAHVRIEPGRTSPAPRLHYLDDCANTGKVYVGYLGRHLPTRRGE